MLVSISYFSLAIVWIRDKQLCSRPHTSHLVTCRSSCHLCNYLLQRLVWWQWSFRRSTQQGFNSNNFKFVFSLSFSPGDRRLKIDLSPWTWVLMTLTRLFFLIWWVRMSARGGGVGACLSWPPHDHQWVDYATFCTTWYKTKYATYALVADWRYAGIQLLFITPNRGRISYPDRISL